MSDPVQRSHFWLFDAEQLDEALGAFVASALARGDADESMAGEMRDFTTWFLNSDECIERGMRRGGED